MSSHHPQHPPTSPTPSVLPPPNYSTHYTPPHHLPQHDQTVLEQQHAGPDAATGEAPPPLYDELYGSINLEDVSRRSGLSGRLVELSGGEDPGVGGRASVTEDGRVDVKINQRTQTMSKLLKKQWLPSESSDDAALAAAPIPTEFRNVPKLNILIQIIGSRGDVQPFIALGRALKLQHGHRVRVATHPVFKKFVEENGLEFFSLGGDPSEMMAFMVKNPGLVPGVESLRNGDVGKRRKDMWEMLLGGWRACYEPGDGMGGGGGGEVREFVADAIIANPPSFGHVHCAEKLGVPLHLMFTMPWSPTNAFPHPLANIKSTNTDLAFTNFLTYIFVELLTYQGLGDIVNKFREQTLSLSPISTLWAPGAISRLRVPHTYCWSPALIPKPADWGPHIGLSGFFFLDLAGNFSPPPELERFLAAGPAPVYIGFGSIVVEDPTKLTRDIIRAIELVGCRAVVSKGWGGLGTESLHLPNNILFLDNVPHDWLFPRCAAVVHHGGAGTTAAGIRAGKPTVVVPFFGDQQFWGSMISRAGAGPHPLPNKELGAETLAECIQTALSDDAKTKARELGERIRSENGVEEGVTQFHNSLVINRCDILPDRIAVWRIKKSGAKLSAVAAAVLVSRGLVEGDWDGLRLERHKEWLVDDGPIEPLSGGAGALMGTISGMMGGVSDIPRDFTKIFTDKSKSATPNPSSPHPSSPRASSPPPNSPPLTSQQKLQTAMESAPGISRIVTTGLRSPLDFTLSLARGFRNAPRLYNDPLIRPPPPPVTGLHSGLRTAAKELGLGLYDGITGLVTQPIEGGKTGGAAGAVKGFGKGAAGLVLKGGAGFWGMQAYVFEGLNKQIMRGSAKDVGRGIASSRMATGLREAAEMEERELEEIVKRWEKKPVRPQEHRGFWSSHSRDKSTDKGKYHGKHTSSADSNKTSFSSTTAAQEAAAFTGTSGHTWMDRKDYIPTAPRDAEESEEDRMVEEAIRRSVLETSSGNPDEDRQVEEAIRASMMYPEVAQEMRVAIANERAASPPTKHNEDDEAKAIEEAIRRSREDDARGIYGRGSPLPQHVQSKPKMQSAEDEELAEAIRRSQQSTPQIQTPQPTHGQEDDDIEEAIRRSLLPPGADPRAGGSGSHSPHPQPTQQYPQTTGAVNTISQPGQGAHTINMVDNTSQPVSLQLRIGEEEEDEDLRRALEESLKTFSSPPPQKQQEKKWKGEREEDEWSSDEEEDEEMKRAIRESLKEGEERRKKVEKRADSVEEGVLGWRRGGIE